MEDIPTQVREFLRKILVFGEQNRTIQKYAPFILSISLACWMLRGLQWYLIALSMHQFSLRRWTLYSYTRCLPSSPSSRSLLPGGKSIRQVSIVIVFAAMGASGIIATSFAHLPQIFGIAWRGNDGDGEVGHNELIVGAERICGLF